MAAKPDHKRNPGDFGLTPPAAPRSHKSLCDDARVFDRATALALLRDGVSQGLLSKQTRQGFPARIWAVRDDNVVFEAKLENEQRGDYHGYPLARSDPNRLVVLQRLGRGDG